MSFPIVKPGEPLIVGSIVENSKGEYGVVMQDQSILRISKEKAEELMRKFPMIRPAHESRVTNHGL
jgi:hypothetical protein